MVKQKIIWTLGFLALVNFVTAEDGSNQRAGFQFPSFPGFQFPGFGGSGSGSPSFGFFPFSIPGFPSFPGFGKHESPSTDAPASSTAAPEESTTAASSRRKRDAERSNDSDFHRSPRFPMFTSCNHTAQPGPSCTTCSQALLCFPNNVGIATSCFGLFRHCNDGICSPFPSETCKSSTTPAAAGTTNNVNSASESSSTTESTTANV